MTKMTWWKAAGIRAIKTLAQTAIATIGTSAVLSEVNWLAVALVSFFLGAAFGLLIAAVLRANGEERP